MRFGSNSDVTGKRCVAPCSGTARHPESFGVSRALCTCRLSRALYTCQLHTEKVDPRSTRARSVFDSRPEPGSTSRAAAAANPDDCRAPTGGSLRGVRPGRRCQGGASLGGPVGPRAATRARPRRRRCSKGGRAGRISAAALARHPPAAEMRCGCPTLPDILQRRRCAADADAGDALRMPDIARHPPAPRSRASSIGSAQRL